MSVLLLRPLRAALPQRGAAPRSRYLLVANRARSYATSREAQPPSVPTIESCPSPTCSCSPMPAMPEGLPLDYKTPLAGLCPSYAEQVLICTGKDDWPSKMEEEHGGDNLAADLKELMGRGGAYNDPFHNVMVTNSSLPSSAPPPSHPELQNTSVYLLPSFKYIPHLPRVSFDHVTALVRGYLQPDKLHSAHDGLSPIHRDRLVRRDEYQSLLNAVTDVQDVLVLICGHGGRDGRCGVLGPVLRDEFAQKLDKEGLQVLGGPVETGGTRRRDVTAIEGRTPQSKVGARIGLISHIGGHKFAGNVIIYIPPGMRQGGGRHPLAGYGIWYGRIDTSNVEGVVSETIVNGRVIKENFRGGIDPERKPLRI